MEDPTDRTENELSEQFENMTTKELLDCRMYEARYPEVDDVVMVVVRSIGEMGAYVTLLEYNNIEGMILMSELSRRRIRSVNKLIRVGRTEAVVVLRVDAEKGYIDLSKRRATPEDIEIAERKWTKSKTVHSIMRNLSKKLNIPVELLYQKFCWPLYRKYGHAYDAFKLAVTSADEILGEYQLDQAIMKELLDIISKRLAPQPLKIRADLQCTCFTFEGIDAIKTALMEAKKFETENYPISLKLLAPPQYVMTTVSLDKEEGIKTLQRACDAIKVKLTELGGAVTILQQARAITERDEKDLTQMMEKLEAENRQVDGDDDFDEMDE